MKRYGKRLRLSPDEVEMVYKARAEPLENINDNTALDLHIRERGIIKDDIVSVKHWQSASGDYRFSIVTKEDVGVDENEVIKKISDFIGRYSPDYPITRRKKLGNHLLIINPADIHIGKYSHELETGDGYDCETAYNRVLAGVEGLIDKANGFNVEKILFCIGNDVLHIDNVYETTTKGTRQDCDKKWWEHLDIALELYIKCIEMLRKVAPVDVIHSMSNHDYQSGYHLAKNLESWFRKAKDVDFDVSVSHRSYYQYGNSLIGFEHGEGAKMDNLPLLMAQEEPKLWAETKFRYWYLHHLHHKIKYKWKDGKDYIGVTVEYLRSPSGVDSWHSRKGFCGVYKAVEGFIHEKNNGQIARFTHYF